MKTPLVTIVTPTFNQDAFIVDTIRSVLNQDYPHIEYIVINDGSTDNTKKVLEPFADKCRIIHQENIGQSETLNRGWTMAEGEIIGYLSSDDLLDRSAVSRSVAAILETPGCVACYCDFELIDAEGSPKGRVTNGDFSPRKLIEDLICQPGPGAFFFKEKFLACGLWDASLHQLPDFDFWLRLSRLGTFVRIPEVLAYYRVHIESASLRPISRDRSVEIVKVMEKFWENDPAAPFNRQRSLATSHLFACNNHLRSGRILPAFSHLRRGFTLYPVLFGRPYTLRTIVASILKFIRKK